MFRLTTTLLFALLLQQQCFSRANPTAKRAAPSAENENGREASSSSSSPTERPRPALKMLGPFPLGPGQKGSVKTDYFDPKTYSTKDLRDFHRLTEGLNADIRRMVEETDRIRRTAAVEAEALREQLAAHQQQQNGADGSAAAAELFPHQHLALLLITLTALAVTLLALALANLMLIKTALRHLRGTAADGAVKSGLLLEQGQ